MAKNLWLILALGWTVTVLVLCLVSFRSLPSVEISGGDKYVHAVFHGVFTVLWFRYFQTIASGRPFRNMLKAVLGSLFFGIGIELLQTFCTESRQGDPSDVLANFCGSLVGAAFGLLLMRSRTDDKI